MDALQMALLFAVVIGCAKRAPAVLPGLLTAFFLLCILWVLIFLTIRAFNAIDERASDALLPYLLWVTFAGYLNLGVYLLN